MLCTGALRDKMTAHVLTSDLDESRTVSHPWKFESPVWRVGGGDQGWDEIQQVSHCVQELDGKQGQRLCEGGQLNSLSENEKEQ